MTNTVCSIQVKGIKSSNNILTSNTVICVATYQMYAAIVGH